MIAPPPIETTGSGAFALIGYALALRDRCYPDASIRIEEHESSPTAVRVRVGQIDAAGELDTIEARLRMALLNTDPKPAEVLLDDAPEVNRYAAYWMTGGYARAIGDCLFRRAEVHADVVMEPCVVICPGDPDQRPTGQMRLRVGPVDLTGYPDGVFNSLRKILCEASLSR